MNVFALKFENDKTREQLRVEFNVLISMFCRIIQNTDKIDSNCYKGQGKIKGSRLPDYPKLEKRVVSRIKQCLANDLIGRHLINKYSIFIS